MAKFVIYRTIGQKAVVEADDIEGARHKAIYADGVTWLQGGVGALPNAKDPEPYAPTQIDWEAVAQLPKPTMSGEALHALTRGNGILYYLAGTSPEDVTYDVGLFVVATSPEQAHRLWKAEYAKSEFDYAFQGPVIVGEPTEKRGDKLQIFKLDYDPDVIGALEWHTAVNCVAYLEP